LIHPTRSREQCAGFILRKHRRFFPSGSAVKTGSANTTGSDGDEKKCKSKRKVSRGATHLSKKRARSRSSQGTAKRRGDGEEGEKGNGNGEGKTKSLNEQRPAARHVGQYQAEHQRELKVCKYHPQRRRHVSRGRPETSGGRLHRAEEARAVFPRREDASKISSSPRSVFPMLRTKAGGRARDAREGRDEGCRRDRFASRCAGPAISRRDAAGIMIRYSLTETGEERNFPLLAAVVPTIASRM